MNLVELANKLWKAIWREGETVNIPGLPQYKRRRFEKQYLAVRPTPIPQLTKWLFWGGIAYWILLIRYVPGKSVILWLYPKLFAWFPLPSLLPSMESIQQKIAGSSFEPSFTAVLFLIPWAISSGFALVTMCLDRSYRLNWDHRIVLHTGFLWSYMQTLLKGLLVLVVGLAVAIFALRLDWLMIPFVIKHTAVWLVIVPMIVLGLFRMPFWIKWYEPELSQNLKEAIYYIKKNAPERGMRVVHFPTTGSDCLPDETPSRRLTPYHWEEGTLLIDGHLLSIGSKKELHSILEDNMAKSDAQCTLTIEGQEIFVGLLGELIEMLVEDQVAMENEGTRQI